MSETTKKLKDLWMILLHGYCWVSLAFLINDFSDKFKIPNWQSLGIYILLFFFLDRIFDGFKINFSFNLKPK